MRTYYNFRLIVEFEDGTTKEFTKEPIVAMSLEAALADISEAHQMSYKNVGLLEGLEHV